ncbi:probable cytochrome P450 12c1, mitochondrial [Drosophila subobscura]|uniref:probable cytochrome P450 12c1, mitochondrial n=1 Tax=Drosophila subobscura TaxID=7241 RepID=UPI00155B0B8A|nr:probable cytochrome P450 12c1, mitochondrial [Drosophila subobscura]
MIRRAVQQGIRARYSLAGVQVTPRRTIDTAAASTLYMEQLDGEWNTAKPFAEIPGPTRWQLWRGFQKGGEFHDLDMAQLMDLYQSRFGDLCRVPGLFGMPTTVFTFKVENFERVYRTEGQWPVRGGADPVLHYRANRKDGFFKDCVGLFSNGPEWGRLRSAANPVLMQHRNADLYLEPMQRVNTQFVDRIRAIRDKESEEVPGNFLDTINTLTFESVAVVALDRELGLLRDSDQRPEAQELFRNIKIFLLSLFELGIKPSVYKYISTPTYRKFSKASDVIFDTCSMYVNEAVARIESQTAAERVGRRSVLEQLLQINRKFAVVMAMDMLMGGVDTATSALTGILLSLAKNPQQQQKLREEIVSKLPQPDRQFTLAEMKSLPYLRACIKEAMRMYPVTFGNVRSAGTDVVLDGYRIPQGTHLLMLSTNLLHDERFYPRPKEYLPERWVRPQGDDSTDSLLRNNLNPFVYLPFSFGPRMCVGKRIVDLEMELTVANLVRNFHIEFNYPTENAFTRAFINMPNIPLRFKFTDVKY